MDMHVCMFFYSKFFHWPDDNIDCWHVHTWICNWWMGGYMGEQDYKRISKSSIWQIHGVLVLIRLSNDTKEARLSSVCIPPFSLPHHLYFREYSREYGNWIWNMEHYQIALVWLHKNFSISKFNWQSTIHIISLIHTCISHLSCDLFLDEHENLMLWLIFEGGHVDDKLVGGSIDRVLYVDVERSCGWEILL